MFSFHDTHRTCDDRRNSELAFERKLRNSDEEVDPLVLEALMFMEDGVRPDSHESRPSPFTASSSSAWSSPRTEHRAVSQEFQCGNENPEHDHEDSDSEDEIEPFSLDPRAEFFVENGRVYDRSTLSRHQEVDTPFIPNSVSRDVLGHDILLLPSEETEISPTSETFSLPTVPPIRPPSPVDTSNDFPDYEPAPRRRAAKRRLEPEPEDDEEDEKSDDDEYRPSPPLPPRKKARTTSTPSRRPAPVAPKRPTAHRRARQMPASRNEQSSRPELVKGVSKQSAEECSFICPVCSWQQANKRMPDYQRHLKTHARGSQSDQTRGWWCKGVRLEDRHRYNIASDATIFLFQNQQRIGGCCITFSRRDALKRHLDNPNTPCVGRPSAANED